MVLVAIRESGDDLERTSGARRARRTSPEVVRRRSPSAETPTAGERADGPVFRINTRRELLSTVENEPTATGLKRTHPGPPGLDALP